MRIESKRKIGIMDQQRAKDGKAIEVRDYKERNL
jgi:hypothetical protein